MTCWQWASFFGETGVCDARDKAGFIIGLVSIACWGLAEVPQLVANAAEGSSEGISESLLWLWVFGDVLDVAGCTIADTLPTMVITAWMYVVFTVLLLLQHIYYQRIRTPIRADSKDKSAEDCEAAAPLLSCEHSSRSSSCGGEPDLVAQLLEEHPQQALVRTGRSHTMYGSLRNLSIRTSSSSSCSSLSLSDTGRRLHASCTSHRQRHQRRWRAGPRHRLAASSSPARPSTADAAAGSSTARLPGALPVSFGSAAATSRMLGALAMVALVAFSSARLRGSNAGNSHHAAGRQLLEGGSAPEPQFWGVSRATWGAALGWGMAVTFFLGRVPQVIKNWQRQSCAGLSMEMFVIVLTAAATYCASILIRARSWADLLPKLPFLVDAAVGALLDLAILCQFFIYSSADEPEAAAGGGEPKAQGKGTVPPCILCHAGTFGSSSSSSSSSHLDKEDRQRQPTRATDILSVADIDAVGIHASASSFPLKVHSSTESGLGLSCPVGAAATAPATGPCSAVGLDGLLELAPDVLLQEDAAMHAGGELEEEQACSWTDSLISIATI